MNDQVLFSVSPEEWAITSRLLLFLTQECLVWAQRTLCRHCRAPSIPRGLCRTVSGRIRDTRLAKSVACLYLCHLSLTATFPGDFSCRRNRRGNGSRRVLPGFPRAWKAPAWAVRTRREVDADARRETVPAGSVRVPRSAAP